MLKNLLNFFKRSNVTEPPYDYYFLLNLDKSEYPKYLKKLYKFYTGRNLNLNHPKTFTEKIQYIKLYNATPLKTRCTDKILVREYVNEKIGNKYLKPVLQICDNFDEIYFANLPNSFVIKCNHGCKWQYIIKDKFEYLNNRKITEITRKQISGWLEQDYSFFNGFELNYHGIQPKLLIEPLLRDKFNKNVEEIQVYCFNGVPKLFLRIEEGTNDRTTLYDENLKILHEVLSENDYNIHRPKDNTLELTSILSKQLSKYFLFVRVDWMLFQNRLYFAELTFTPYSGFNTFSNNWDKIMGAWMK